MSIVAADWSISAGKVIDYIGDDHGGASPSYATGIELHRWLSDLTDDAAYTGDDIIDRTLPVPSKRSTDFIIRLVNGYTITANAIEHLYDVSITQGTDGVDQIIWDAIVVQGNATTVHIIQNGAKLADDWWNSNGGLNPDAAKGITHRFLIKVHDFVANGGDIDGRRLIGTSRPWNKTWKESIINGTERGKNYMFLDAEDDLNNQSTTVAVSGLVGISNQNEGRIGIDANLDLSDEFYFSSWTYGGNSINDLYEHTKYLGYDGSAATLYGLPAAVFRGITHKFNYDTEAGGTFAEATALTFGNGATAQLLALKDDGTTGTMWVQLLTGDAPSNDDTITQGAVTAAVNGAVTSIPIKAPFIGVSTGTAIIGNYGQGISSVLTPNDKLTDLDGNPVQPPSNVSVTVSNLVAAQGSVTCYPWDGVSVDSEGNPAVDYNQMTVAGANLTGAAVTSIQVNAIPNNTPDTGQIRVVCNSGAKKLISYSAHNGTNAFTITSTDFSTDNANIGNGVFVAYIDEQPAATSESFNYTYGGDTKAVVEVRDPTALIVPFITGITLGNNSQTINTIRNSDA